MERIFRQFIIFQGFAVGVLSIVHSLKTLYDYTFDSSHYREWDYNNDIHGILGLTIPRELCWIVASSSLLCGIHRRNVRYFYPIVCVAIVALVIQFVREVVLFWTLQNSDEVLWDMTLFSNPVLMFSMAGRRFHGMMTLIALKRLFESEQNTDNSFVRFNAESEACETSDAR